MNLLNQKQYQCVIRLFNKLTPGVVLDIGFGNGYLLKRLGESQIYTGETNFYGIEISEDMLKAAYKRNRKLI